MNELDEINRNLGSLIAQVAENTRQNSAIFAKMDKMNEEVIEHRGALKLLGSELTEHKHVNKNVHMKVNALENQFEAAKNKGKGFTAGIALLGGGGGLAGLTALWKLLSGH